MTQGRAWGHVVVAAGSAALSLDPDGPLLEVSETAGALSGAVIMARWRTLERSILKEYFFQK